MQLEEIEIAMTAKGLASAEAASSRKDSLAKTTSDRDIEERARR